MKLVEFPEQTIVVAKNQPQYIPLPAHIARDEEGTLTCCWQLTWRDRITVLFTGKIWHQVLTFKSRLQPQKLSVNKPKLSRDA